MHGIIHDAGIATPIIISSLTHDWWHRSRRGRKVSKVVIQNISCIEVPDTYMLLKAAYIQALLVASQAPLREELHVIFCHWAGEISIILRSDITYGESEKTLWKFRFTLSIRLYIHRNWNWIWVNMILDTGKSSAVQGSRWGRKAGYFVQRCAGYLHAPKFSPVH